MTRIDRTIISDIASITCNSCYPTLLWGIERNVPLGRDGGNTLIAMRSSEDEARAAYDAANNAIEFLINKMTIVMKD